MSRKHQLAELQLAIMQVLWEQGEATVAAVQGALRPRRELAYTTVGTMLAKMEANGQVAHRSDGRVNIYRPLLHREQVSRSMVNWVWRVADGKGWPRCRYSTRNIIFRAR